jgi:hypothetical protein
MAAAGAGLPLPCARSGSERMSCHSVTMKRGLRVALWVYLAGAVACELLSLWVAYDNGGFQRHHTLADLAIVGSLDLATAMLWPVVLVVVVLQYFGFLPHPITF